MALGKYYISSCEVHSESTQFYLEGTGKRKVSYPYAPPQLSDEDT